MSTSKNKKKKSLSSVTSGKGLKGAQTTAKQTTTPVAVSYGNKTKTGSPQFVSLPNGACRITHREFIRDVISSSTDWSILTTLTLNPGSETTFNWLNKIARNFEKYRFLKLRLIYESQVSTSMNGSVQMAVDYNATDAAPTAKSSLMSYAGASRCNAWQNMTFICSPQDLTDFAKQRYIQSDFTNSEDSKEDPRVNDLGNLFVALNGSTSGAVIGELYVEYTVELHTPITRPGLFSDFGKITGAGTLTAPWTSGSVTQYGNSCPLKISTAGQLEFIRDAEVLLVVEVGSTMSQTVGPTAGGSATFVTLAGSATGNGITFRIIQYSILGVTGDTFTLNFSAVGGSVSLLGRVAYWPYGLVLEKRSLRSSADDKASSSICLDCSDRFETKGESDVTGVDSSRNSTHLISAVDASGLIHRLGAAGDLVSCKIRTVDDVIFYDITTKSGGLNHYVVEG